MDRSHLLHVHKPGTLPTWLKLEWKPCWSSGKQWLLFIPPGKFCDSRFSPGGKQDSGAVITVLLTKDGPDECSCYRHQSKYRQAPCDCVADVNLLFKLCSLCDLWRKNKWSEEDSKILPIYVQLNLLARIAENQWQEVNGMENTHLKTWVELQLCVIFISKIYLPLK